MSFDDNKHYKCVKIFDKVISCADLDINTLNNLLRLNMIDSYVVLKPLDILLELSSLEGHYIERSKFKFYNIKFLDNLTLIKLLDNLIVLDGLTVRDMLYGLLMLIMLYDFKGQDELDDTIIINILDSHFVFYALDGRSR